MRLRRLYPEKRSNCLKSQNIAGRPHHFICNRTGIVRKDHCFSGISDPVNIKRSVVRRFPVRERQISGRKALNRSHREDS